MNYRFLIFIIAVLTSRTAAKVSVPDAFSSQATKNAGKRNEWLAGWSETKFWKLCNFKN